MGQPGTEEISWPATISKGRRVRLPKHVADQLGVKDGERVRFITTSGDPVVRVVRLREG